MSILDFFRTPRRKHSGTAQQAKERLQIIVAREGVRRNTPDFLPRMKRELLEVVGHYVTVNADQVSVNLEHEGDYEVLELNITIPDGVQKVSNA